MDALNNLKRNPGAKKAKRKIGRGNGSNRGSTCGRGENGQKSRNGGNIRPGFTGGQTSLLKKMPKLKGFKNPNRKVFSVVNLSALNVFDDNSEIDKNALFEKKLISSIKNPIKILGSGELSKKLTVKINHISSSAKTKIENAGGQVVQTKSE